MNSTPRFALSNLSNFKPQDGVFNSLIFQNIQSKSKLLLDPIKPLNDTPFQPKTGLNQPNLKGIEKDLPADKKFGSSYKITEVYYNCVKYKKIQTFFKKRLFSKNNLRYLNSSFLT